jgi:hypothetical protein
MRGRACVPALIALRDFGADSEISEGSSSTGYHPAASGFCTGLICRTFLSDAVRLAHWPGSCDVKTRHVVMPGLVLGHVFLSGGAAMTT